MDSFVNKDVFLEEIDYDAIVKLKAKIQFRFVPSIIYVVL